MHKQKQLIVSRQKCSTPCVKAISRQSVSVRFCGNSCNVAHAPFGIAGKPAFGPIYGAIRFDNGTQNCPLLR